MFESIRPSERMLTAVVNNQPEELLAALSDGADPNFVRTKNTPLLLALANGNKECAQILVDRGADINMPNSQGWRAIHEVCERGWEDWVEMIMDNPMASVDCRDRSDATPLLIAVKAGNEGVARRLVARNCNVNAQDDHGVSPLMLAIERQSLTLVQEMMQKRGDPSLKDATGRSGLDRAENWDQGRALLGNASAAVAAPVAQEASEAPAADTGVSGIQKRRRPA